MFWDGRSIFWEPEPRRAARDVVEFAGLYRREIGVQRADRISSLLKALSIALQFHLQGFRFSPTSAAPERGRGEGRGLRRRKRGAAALPAHGWRTPALVIARDDFVRSLRKSPEVAAALGVPTDLKAEEALDQLHRLKYDSPRDPEAGVGLRELAAYYALWTCGARCGARAPRRVTPSREARTCRWRSRRRSPRRSRASPTRPTTRSRCASALYLLKRVADLRSTIARAERIVQTPALHYARHTSRSSCTTRATRRVASSRSGASRCRCASRRRYFATPSSCPRRRRPRVVGVARFAGEIGDAAC